jgi:hypothetical protein
MSTGGLLQLLAKGAIDDAYLVSRRDQLKDRGITTHPYRTLFKKTVPFATQVMDVDLVTTQGWGERVTATLPRKGDLVSRMYLEITMRRASGETYFPAEQFVQEVRLQIGTQTVDTHTSEYFRVRSELFDTPEAAAAYRRLTDFVDSEPAGSVKTMFLPLRFSTCDPGRALPLVAMPFTQASLEFTFASSVAGVDSGFNPDVKLWVEYTYLDAEDRRILATTDLDLPFEQIQVHEESARVTASTQTVRLPFRNAVKWLAWTCADPSKHGVFSGGSAGEKNPAIGIVATSTLTFNSHERVRGSAAFFNVLQPTMSLGRAPCAGLYMYPFASDMTSLASTGSANFTIIDVVILALTFKRITEATVSSGLASQDETIASASRLTRLRVYAASWNVLRFTQGECGLAYV